MEQIKDDGYNIIGGKMNRTIKKYELDLEQIEASKASGGAIYTIPENIWETYGWIAEEKLDGTRLKMHITPEGNRFDTRRISDKTQKFMERTNNFPHLRDLELVEFKGTILDGEGIAPVKIDTMGATQSIVGASPEHAWERQQDIGWIKYRTFDLIKYQGKDARAIPFRERRIILEDIVKKIRLKYPDTTIEILVQRTKNMKKFYELEIGMGKEGIMLKNLDGLYGDIHSLLKVKKHTRLTMIVTGFKDGAGKHKGKVGSVGIGFYGEKQLTYAGGLSDVLRQDMQDNPNEYLGKTIEIECQEFTKTGALRHPRVVGTNDKRNSQDIEQEKLRIFRLDKNPEDCKRSQEIKIR